MKKLPQTVVKRCLVTIDIKNLCVFSPLPLKHPDLPLLISLSEDLGAEKCKNIVFSNQFMISRLLGTWISCMGTFHVISLCFKTTLFCSEAVKNSSNQKAQHFSTFRPFLSTPWVELKSGFTGLWSANAVDSLTNHSACFTCRNHTTTYFFCH